MRRFFGSSNKIVSVLSHSHSFFLDNVFLELETINCGVPQGFILGLLLFLLYTNDIPQALPNCRTYLNADNISIFHKHKNVLEIENILNEEFENACDRFVDSKLSIHFGKDKSKCIL